MAQRGIVKGPNQSGAAGNRATNGSVGLVGARGAVAPPNMGMGNDNRGGSFSLDGSASPVNPPSANRFNVGQVGMPDQPFPTEPGKGAVPVNPFQPGGAPSRSLPVSDMAAKR